MERRLDKIEATVMPPPDPQPRRCVLYGCLTPDSIDAGEAEAVALEAEGFAVQRILLCGAFEEPDFALIKQEREKHRQRLGVVRPVEDDE